MHSIRRIWLQQPLAFARVGSSQTPLTAFRWTQPDLRPRGTGRTMISPAASFSVDSGSGEVSLAPDSKLTLFKDKEGIRPVCPFFELHGEWDGQRPEDDTLITEETLQSNNLSLANVTWKIHHANHKAYSLTHSEGDRIEARAECRGNDHSRHILKGQSPANSSNPLIPIGQFIPMGEIQAVQPTRELPAIRLRFYAPAGAAFAPANLEKRLKRKSSPLDYLIALFDLNSRWKDVRLDSARCILNENAAWPQYKLLTYGQLLAALPRMVRHFRAFLALCRQVQLSELARFIIGPLADAGKLPPGLFASRIGDGAVLTSLGFVDDLGDGVITCEVDNVPCVAQARIVVAPPHFSPDRRPPVSIADNLTDRQLRADVRSSEWTSPANWASLESEIDDLMDRAFETAGLSNLDAWNQLLRTENESDAVYRNDEKPPANPSALLWPDLKNETVLGLPLVEHARWRHRRNSVDAFFEQLICDSDDLMKRWVRNPDDSGSLYYDRRMPALMRGADRRPLHLTRRQLEAFAKWVTELKRRQEDSPHV